MILFLRFEVKFFFIKKQNLVFWKFVVEVERLKLTPFSHRHPFVHLILLIKAKNGIRMSQNGDVKWIIALFHMLTNGC